MKAPSHPIHTHTPHTYIQAIGDGGQGWGNVLLYVLASDKIRTRLLGQMFGCCSEDDEAPHAPPPRRIPDIKKYQAIDQVDHHAFANQSPVAVNIQKQAVSYTSPSHEATTSIN